MSDILHYLVSIPKHLLKPSDSDKSGSSNFRTVRVQVYKLAGEIMKEHNVLHCVIDPGGRPCLLPRRHEEFEVWQNPGALVQEGNELQKDQEETRYLIYYHDREIMSTGRFESFAKQEQNI